MVGGQRSAVEGIVIYLTWVGFRRSRLGLLAAFYLLAVLLAPALPAPGPQDRIRLALLTSQNALLFFGSLLSVFFAASLVAPDRDQRILHVVLSKPLSRARLLLGRFLGLAAVLLGLAAVLGLLGYAAVLGLGEFLLTPQERERTLTARRPIRAERLVVESGREGAVYLLSGSVENRAVFEFDAPAPDAALDLSFQVRNYAPIPKEGEGEEDGHEGHGHEGHGHGEGEAGLPRFDPADFDWVLPLVLRIETQDGARFTERPFTVGVTEPDSENGTARVSCRAAVPADLRGRPLRVVLRRDRPLRPGIPLPIFVVGASSARLGGRPPRAFAVEMMGDGLLFLHGPAEGERVRWIFPPAGAGAAADSRAEADIRLPVGGAHQPDVRLTLAADGKTTPLRVRPRVFATPIRLETKGPNLPREVEARREDPSLTVGFGRDGLVLFDRPASFSANYAKGLVLIFCHLLLAGIVVLSTSVFVSGPVASFVGLALCVGELLVGWMAYATPGAHSHRGDDPHGAASLVERVGNFLAPYVQAAFPSMEVFSPSAFLAEGLDLPVARLGTAAAYAAGGFVLFGGIALWRFRNQEIP